MIKQIITASLLTFSMVAEMQVSFAQTANETNQKDFGEFMDRTGNYFRAASGNPGVGYWQNAADYQLEVSLDDVNHILSGKVTIAYTNNSPESLDFIWLLGTGDLRKGQTMHPSNSCYAHGFGPRKATIGCSVFWV
jgi:uncharacterized cupin superfamily protein